MNKIVIYDAIMGSGKTHDAIDKIKTYIKEGQKFIYITPFLAEINRVKESLPYDSVKVPLSFKESKDIPYKVIDGIIDDKGNIDLEADKIYKPLNKRAQFLKFVSEGENVISTHSLFSTLKKGDFSFFKDYILILDEVIDPLEIKSVGQKDVQILVEQELIIIDDETKEVRFINEDYNDPAFKEIKTFCNTSTVYYLDRSFFVWIFPEEIFREFKQIQVLTYLFRGSLLSAYFEMLNLEYSIISKDETEDLNEIKKLLNLYEGLANEGVKSINTFSKTWCNGLTKRKAKRYSDKASNILKRNFRTHSKYNAFTTFKQSRGKLSGNSYAKGFIPVNARATNNFSQKKSMAYMANRFFKPQHRTFFAERGVKLNEELWALGELVQWLWRGCIRNKEEMNLYIPSYRMRDLLIRWLKGEFIEKDNITRRKRVV